MYIFSNYSGIIIFGLSCIYSWSYNNSINIFTHNNPNVNTQTLHTGCHLHKIHPSTEQNYFVVVEEIRLRRWQTNLHQKFLGRELNLLILSRDHMKTCQLIPFIGS